MKEYISPILREKLPSYIRQDYGAFEKFIIDYLQEMEQDGGLLDFISAWKQNQDIDISDAPFLDAMLKDMGWDWDGDLVIGKTLLAHSLRDFYLERGTERSFRFLFRALFNETPRIQYPRERMLVPSSAIYATECMIYCTTKQVGTDAFKSIMGKLGEGHPVMIQGVGSASVTTIESITQILSKGKSYLEIYITEPIQPFDAGEDVKIVSGDDVVIESNIPILVPKIIDGGKHIDPSSEVRVTGCGIDGVMKPKTLTAGGVTSIYIDKAGTGYKVGDSLTAKTFDAHGFGFFGKVTQVGTNGEIQAVKIINTGSGYRQRPVIGISSSTGGGASIGCDSVSIGGIATLETIQPYADPSGTTTIRCGNSTIEAEQAAVFFRSRHITRLGVLGENSVLTDSDRYQHFSYEVISAVPKTTQDAVVQRLLHPYGYVRATALEIHRSGIRNISFSGNNLHSTAPAIQYIETKGGEIIQTLLGNEIEARS